MYIDSIFQSNLFQLKKVCFKVEETSVEKDGALLKKLLFFFVLFMNYFLMLLQSIHMWSIQTKHLIILQSFQIAHKIASS